MTSFEAELFNDQPVEPAFSNCGNCEGCPLITNAEYWVGVHQRSNAQIMAGLQDGTIEQNAQRTYEAIADEPRTDASYEGTLQALLKDAGSKMSRSDRAIESHIAEREKYIALCGGVVRALVVQQELDGEQTEYTFTSCGSPSLPLIEGELYSRAVVTYRRRL